MRAQITSFSSIAILSLLLPSLAGAVTLFDTLAIFSTLFNGVIGLFIVLAIVVFFWGLIKYIFNREGGEKEGAEGAQLMIWGILAIFVMVSIWGIIGLLRSTFRVTDNAAIVPAGIGVGGIGGINSGSGGIQVGVQFAVPIK